MSKYLADELLTEKQAESLWGRPMDQGLLTQFRSELGVDNA